MADNARLTAFVPLILHIFEKNFSSVLKNAKYCKQAAWLNPRALVPRDKIHHLIVKELYSGFL
jgi:hypothetical protein